MALTLVSDAELMRRLGLHPELRSQIESLVLAVQDETGELKTANAAEMRVIEVIHRTGHDALQAWANRQVEKTSQETKQGAGVWSEGKKTLLAHHLRRHQRRRTPVSSGPKKDPCVRTKRPSQQPGLLTPAAARNH